MSLLEKMVDQYVELHGVYPTSIVLTPFAVLALALKEGLNKSLSYKGQTIPLTSTDFDYTEVVDRGSGSRLGVMVSDSSRLTSVDLR